MATPLPQLPAPNVPDIYEKTAETIKWLQANVKVGYTSQRGPAWWANEATRIKGDVWTGMPEGSHFPGPIPIEVVTAQLDVKLVKGESNVTYVDAEGHRQVVKDPRVQPIVNATTGKVFSYPTATYTIHPYLKTLHGFITRILDDSKVGVGSVGLLKDGGVAFLQARLNEQFEVAGYGYQPYITAVTSADLSRATFYGTGALGAVCDNTVNTAILGALTKLRIKHTRNSMPSVQHARERLGIQLVQVGESIGEAIDGLLKVDVSDEEFRQWLDLTVPVPEKDPKSRTGGRSYTMATTKREGLEALWNHDPKVKPWAGTGFGILQLDNTYRTWNQMVRAADGGRVERNFSNDAFGITAKADADAMDALAEVKGRKLVLA